MTQEGQEKSWPSSFSACYAESMHTKRGPSPLLFLILALALFAFLHPLASRDALPPPPSGYEPAPEFAAASKVVSIDLPDGYGSGIPVKSYPNGLTMILTARHVAEHVDLSQAGENTVRLGDHTAQVARVVLHPTLDVALMMVAGDEFETVEVDIMPPQLGTDAWAVGWVGARYRLFGRGPISMRDAVTADALPGCSGGAIIQGTRTIGVLVQTMRNGDASVGALAIFVPSADFFPWMLENL